MPIEEQKEEILNLAYIGQILTVSSIPEADRIQAVEVFCGDGG